MQLFCKLHLQLSEQKNLEGLSELIVVVAISIMTRRCQYRASLSLRGNGPATPLQATKQGMEAHQ